MGLRVEAKNLTVQTRGGSEAKKLLHNVSFQIEPGEFICVLGPSGSGKTTLVRSLLGELEISSGQLLVGGHDVFREANALRGAIGYVPQRDINPPSLTVERALHYASIVRLPKEAVKSDHSAAVDRVVEQLGLERARKTTISKLSGGEAKRAVLAAEMLGGPGLLVVDEATSSLDPATETRIMSLLADRARAGTTVITITHHLVNVDMADKILILGHGEVVWFGTRIEALVHFNVHRLADIYLAIEDSAPGYWSAKWRELQNAELSATLSEQQSESVTREQPEAEKQRIGRLAHLSPPGSLRQFSMFLQRQLDSFFHDRSGFILNVLLPIALAVVVLLGFAGTRFRDTMMLTRFLESGEKEVLADVWGEIREAISKDSVAQEGATIPAQIRVFLDSQPMMLAHLREPSTQRLVKAALTDTIRLAPDREIINPAGTLKWVSLMSICMVILGFVTGFREIVKERPMLDLERRHGLHFASYVLAKVVYLGIILGVQVAIFRTTVELGFVLRDALGGDTPAEIYRRGPAISASYNWLAAVACSSFALIVSACARSTDRGVLAVPLLITPQILLGATILPITGGAFRVVAMLFSPLYWAHRGCRSEGNGVPIFWQNLGAYDTSLWIPYAALIAQIVAATAITVIILRWQEHVILGRNLPKR
ncbi:MAG: hypothetical protein RLY14_2124 [Planctomycetota bacterium]|jgi:ABC-type multidrug transport system ATPase subunit